MLVSEHERLRAAIRDLSGANDAADVVAKLARAALLRGVTGVVIDLGPMRRGLSYVGHVDAKQIERGRVARGDGPLTASQLAAATELVHVRRGAPDDPLERVRTAWGADEIAVVPIATDARMFGVLAMFGQRIALEHARALELLASAAGNALLRMDTLENLRARLRATDAALSLLTSLVEDAPLPQVFVDKSLRVLAANDAFAQSHARASDELYGAPLSELPIVARQRVVDAVLRVLERGAVERIEVAEDGRAFVVALHPAVATPAVGITFVDISALHAVVVQSRAVADASMVMGLSGDRATALDALTATYARTLGDAAVALRVTGELDARTGDESIERFARELLEHVPTRGPARALRTGTADALTVDDLSLLSRPAPVHLLAVPLRARDAERVIVVSRPSHRRPFDGSELALATDIAKIAARALDEYTATATATAWAELFADFVSTISRELRDAITAMYTRLFMTERGPAEERVEHLAEVRRITERMRETLTRLDRAAPPPPRRADDPIDLAALAAEGARSVTQRLVPGARLFEQLTSVPTVRGDLQRLREALRGVAEHVALTAGEGSLICVRVEHAASEVVVSFSRTGAGLGADEARHVFDALWQGRDTARALTIARAVFNAHGGRAWVETAEDSGVAYCFALPVQVAATVA